MLDLAYKDFKAAIMTLKFFIKKNVHNERIGNFRKDIKSTKRTKWKFKN